MTHHRFVRARLLPAALALAAISLPSSAAAVGGPQAFDPESTPAVYPGTSTPAPAWNLLGIATAPIPFGYTASHVIVSPRWVLASRHSATYAGEEFISVEGERVRVKKVFKPNQHFAEQPGVRARFEDGGADISLVLLDEAVEAPVGGYPLLMQDFVGADITSSLPGRVLWSGQGGVYQPGSVRSAWSLPNGTAAPEVAGGAVPALINGDSGSAGAWYRSAGARPVLAGVVTVPMSGPSWGSHEQYAAQLKQERVNPQINEPLYPTAAAWIKARVAAERAIDPTLEAPEWTTLSEQGSDPATLRPMAPRKLRVATATPTSITVDWKNSYESRVPRNYYMAEISPGGTQFISKDATSHTFSALDPGRSYTIRVRALNTNGASTPHGAYSDHDARVEPEFLSYVTRPTPSAPTAVASARPSETVQGKVEYCVNIEATTTATAQAGETLTTEIQVEGIDAPAAHRTANGAVTTAKVCSGNQSITPGSTQEVRVRTVAEATPSAWVVQQVTVPAGAPVGTDVPEASGISLAPRRAIVDGKTEYCVAATWQNPVLAGFPLRSTKATLYGSTTKTETLSPTDTDEVFCGLAPDTQHGLQLSSDLTYASAEAWQSATTPAGAARGTTLPGPTSITTQTNLNASNSSCATVAWQEPAAVSGFPVAGYVVTLRISGNVTRTASVGTLARNAQICGLPRGQWFIPTVSAAYMPTVGDAWLTETYGLFGQTA